MGKIYIQTCAYNAEKTLERCLNSVLNQTCYGENIVYHVCDNGSTDKTGEILRKYAAMDSRIVPIYIKENCLFDEEHDIDKFLLMLNDDDYYCTLDSDDEYKLDFLEKIISFVEKNDLDFGVCGNDFIDDLTGNVVSERVLPQAMILSEAHAFMNYFPVYHQFMRTIWGKIYTGKIARILPSPFTRNRPPKGVPDVYNGFDTISVFHALRHSKRVGIFPETLHRYYMKSKSASRRWYSLRIESNQVLYEDAENYLISLGPISDQNREFLDCVYANAISDSLIVLSQCTNYSEDDPMFCGKELLADDKLKELHKIVRYRVTAETIARNKAASINCKRHILNAALNFELSLKRENADFDAALSLICPNCASFIQVGDVELVAREPALQDALFNDNLTAFVERLLGLISKGMYSKQFDLFEMLKRFSVGRGLVSEITDEKFIKNNSVIFFLLWNKKYIQALDSMTEVLLKKTLCNETFFQIYLTLSAMLESADEFIFGKVKLASFYCDAKRIEECAAVLDELVDMGVEDNEEIIRIKSTLKR